MPQPRAECLTDFRATNLVGGSKDPCSGLSRRVVLRVTSSTTILPSTDVVEVATVDVEVTARWD